MHIMKMFPTAAKLRGVDEKPNAERSYPISKLFRLPTPQSFV